MEEVKLNDFGLEFGQKMGWGYCHWVTRSSQLWGHTGGLMWAGSVLWGLVVIEDNFSLIQDTTRNIIVIKMYLFK